MENYKKKVLKFLGLAFLLFYATSCTKELTFVDSTMLKPDKVNLLKIGSTTKEQLIKDFGSPESKVSLDGGKESFFYKDLNLRSLWVEFNNDGIVSDFRFSGK